VLREERYHTCDSRSGAGDLGAHRGLYMLLASKRVGPSGRVFAFEPSPRERRTLRLHLMLNRRRNVVLQKYALGNEDGAKDLFVVQGSQTGCNSLRPPIALSGTVPVRVQVTRIDDWVTTQKISSIGFIKLDVEGSEMSVLEGAAELLKRRPRPVILAEVQDLRTEPWGYKAKDILIYLETRRYKWFSLVAGGELEYLDVSPLRFDGNFVAFPEEQLDLARRLLHSGTHAALS
jgi:FkbM family methyltransferase